jgi:hypothetical protein
LIWGRHDCNNKESERGERGEKWRVRGRERQRDREGEGQGERE